MKKIFNSKNAIRFVMIVSALVLILSGMAPFLMQ